MNTEQYKVLKNREDRLKAQNQALRDKLAAARTEAQRLRRDLKESQSLLKDVPGALVLIQQDNIVAYVNETPLEKLGYTREEVMGREFIDFVHPDYRANVRRVHQKRLSGKVVGSQYETYLLKKDGQPLYCEVHVKKTRYKGRRGFLVNIISREDKKVREKETIQSQKQEALHCMASGIKVRLQEVTDLLGECTEGIQDVMADEKLSRFLEKAQAAAALGTHLSQQMDCLTRMENSKSDLVLVDLKRLVQEAVAISRSKWQGHDHGKEIHVKTYLRTLSPVEGHPRELLDVLVSMIMNGADALPGGGEIHITTEENSGFANVYIQDDGVGIPQAIRAKIFDPFFTTKKGMDGGVGLSTAYAVMKRHRGDIEVITHKGQGTTFVLKLPLVQMRSKRRRKDQHTGLKDAHILLISDEGVVRDLLSQLLAGKGCKVTDVSSGTEVLRAMKKISFHLILADLATPYFQYSRVLRKIKEMRPGLPVVLINAQEKGKTPEKLRSVGADLIIERPLDMDRIPALVSRAITAGRDGR